MTANVSKSPAAAALIAVAAFATAASAQTVIVRNAAPSAPIEVVLDADTVATATADSTGMATLTTDAIARLRRDEAGIHVSVDTCGQQRRVLLVEAGVPPPAQAACARATVRDLFSLQRGTTLLVDVGGPSPVVWIRQGPMPIEWLGDRDAAEQPRTWAPPPVGLILSGGLGGASFGDAVTRACGDASTCSGSGLRPNAAAGVSFWIAPWLALDLGVMRPRQLTATGSGTAFSFDSAVDARIVTVAGKAGGQTGPVRIYAIGGANHLSAAATTVQTVTSSAIGAETFGFKADGWSWLAGGGLEFWPVPRVGVYVEGNVLSLKGNAIDNTEGSIDDRLVYVTTGLRVALGRKK